MGDGMMGNDEGEERIKEERWKAAYNNPPFRSPQDAPPAEQSSVCVVVLNTCV